jgi:hypothetical protein
MLERYKREEIKTKEYTSYMQRDVADMQAESPQSLGGDMLAKRSKALRELGLFLIL